MRGVRTVVNGDMMTQPGLMNWLPKYHWALTPEKITYKAGLFYQNQD